MSRNRISSALLLAAGLLLAAPVVGPAEYFAPDASAQQKSKKKSQAARRGEIEQGASPAEIARYFQLYGGYIDPYINKQSPGGPFDSGFFFDSGIGRNGGDSPYLN